MKVVNNEALVMKKKVQRTEIERKILKMLDHLFLPTLYAEFEASHFSCIVMEYCSAPLPPPHSASQMLLPQLRKVLRCGGPSGVGIPPHAGNHLQGLKTRERAGQIGQSHHAL
ncbi:hypothetical protein ACFX15_042610 [Malus domestica]